ncbi:MAG: DUF1295 domain-containing protein [Bacteroidetes bacterium]|jgi:3-oxo-5-alpha-steroid 4-dehydrogenase 1|nr:DUF1295 domain-containing protein [Bacteroidota bacterium]
MISQNSFDIIVIAWIGLAILMVPILLKVIVPYGRHSSSSWGPKINNRIGWFLMEIPVIVIFSWLFFSGNSIKSAPLYIIYGLFMIHYINRIFIFPLRIKSKPNQMPLVIVVSAIFFNMMNGYVNGYWFGYLTPEYPDEWFYDPRFIIGLSMFIIGMIINVWSDNKLINLRKGGKKGYYIPRGGLFDYISSPNLFGEIIEWTGWALMSWCLPSLSFAIWTMANLIPRAIDHHRWYHNRFVDYPKNRKAIFPKIL